MKYIQISDSDGSEPPPRKLASSTLRVRKYRSSEKQILERMRLHVHQNNGPAKMSRLACMEEFLHLHESCVPSYQSKISDSHSEVADLQSELSSLYAKHSDILLTLAGLNSTIANQKETIRILRQNNSGA